MQLLCQRNSLNLRSFTVQEIAEVSEILTAQKNDGALITSSAEASQYSEGRRLCVERGLADTRPYADACFEGCTLN
jgi:hypothetical protein